tara:strand:+ start:1202 stop:1411 length:210 start_codon:yes stop_codon:yes gene_type:complete
MAANQDKQALLLRSAYESAWKGDTKQACDALVDGKKSDNLWLSMGYSQVSCNCCRMHQYPSWYFPDERS